MRRDVNLNTEEENDRQNFASVKLNFQRENMKIVAES